MRADLPSKGHWATNWLYTSVVITARITGKIPQVQIKWSLIHLGQVVDPSETELHPPRPSVHSLQNASMTRSEKRNQQHLSIVSSTSLHPRRG